jgi:hypothetical protein
MTQRQFHWIEKLQVQLSAIGAMAAAYFLLPKAAITFIPTGQLAGVAVLAATVLALTAVCSLTTLSARPEGTLVAVLIGLGGLSLQSGPMRTLLWLRQNDLATMYWQMAAEMVLLAGVVVAAVVVAHAVRGALRRVAGRWVWRDPLASLSEEQQTAYVQHFALRRRPQREDKGKKPKARRKDGGQDRSRSGRLVGFFGGGFAAGIAERMGIAAARREGRPALRGDILARCTLCGLLCLAVTIVLVLLLARSTDRGQVLFAVFGGCTLAALLAYQMFPTRFSVPALAVPVVVAVMFYTLAAIGSLRAGEGAWLEVEACYRALPLDWLTAGVGGGTLGYWISSRMHEASFLEQCEQQEEGA